MSTNTTNYKLVKPELTDTADITQTNQNWDIIDEELAKKIELDESGKVPSSALPEIQSIQTTTAILLVNGWTLGNDGRYYQTISVADVKTDTELVIVDCDLTTDDADARVEILSAWESPSTNEVEQGNGALTFYSYIVPSISIPIFVGVA